ncbi:hypothetical protein BKA62DRAFT_750637 [Auriculariales sp. MPI-PUGE-AT-0066]|nr:hypothetical protein BKA62DRAFT_114112 [Auriculariales sp. MPI-PUGE-AT-0066]KAH7099256.1 hypothetical protein BKA62DRAFT_750637 [Auriculariales sp. MPI-PUGE-AT-0066]
MATPGAFLSLIELGDETSKKEFEEMYEEDHVPPRIALPTFLGGVRLEAADGQQPTIGGIFHITDSSAAFSPEVQKLIANRSERETRISNAYKIVDRRVYKLEYDSVEAGFPCTGETKYVLTVSMTSTDPDNVDKWYAEEHLEMLRAVPGWLRSRRYSLVNGAATGYAEEKQMPKLMALHEWASADALKTPEFKAATSTEWRDRVVASVVASERRGWNVVRVLHKPSLQ